MIKDNLAPLKEKDTKRRAVIRDIKNTLDQKAIQCRIDKVEYTSQVELSALQKLAKQYSDSSAEAIKANRPQIAEENQYALSVIAEFIPAPATEEQIIEVINDLAKSGTLSVKDMKTVIIKVQEKYPATTGGAISKLFKSFLSD